MIRVYFIAWRFAPLARSVDWARHNILTYTSNAILLQLLLGISFAVCPYLAILPCCAKFCQPRNNIRYHSLFPLLNSLFIPSAGISLPLASSIFALTSSPHPPHLTSLRCFSKASLTSQLKASSSALTFLLLPSLFVSCAFTNDVFSTSHMGQRSCWSWSWSWSWSCSRQWHGRTGLRSINSRPPSPSRLAR